MTDPLPAQATPEPESSEPQPAPSHEEPASPIHERPAHEQLELAEERPPPSAEQRAPDDVDLGRRSFFRTFGREAVQAAASVAGAANVLRQGTTAAGAELLGLGLARPADAATRLDQLGFGLEAEVEARYRNPYRFADEELILIDQTQLPDRVAEVRCQVGAEVAGAIRRGVVTGGPILAQVAAYGLALTASRLRASKPYVRAASLRGTENALRNAAPASAELERALERVSAAWTSLPAGSSGDEIAVATRAEADAIASESMHHHAALGREGVTMLPWPADRPLDVLTMGSTGQFSGGIVGTAMAVLVAAATEGRDVRALVAETRPGLVGARLAAFELRNADVPYSVVADAAAGWLLSEGRVDVVLVGAERIAANGDTLATIGTLTLAVLAARSDVPFFVCAATPTIDRGTADGAALPVTFGAPSDVTLIRGMSIAPTGSDALNPTFDVTPADLITGFVTEVGVLRPPFPEA
ncbi:MAG: s-methyl-5-thioribose-1-phosphate isomerase [Candidatus Limnocylindrales bacterium]